MTNSFKDYLRNAGLAAAPPIAVVKTPSSALDRPLTVTFFVDRFTRTKTQEVVTLRALIDRLKTTRAATKAELPWLKLAQFGDTRTDKGSLRHDGNLLHIDGVEADYDAEKITIDHARATLTDAGIASVLYTSPSHTEDAPRWRVLCPTSKTMQPGERSALVARLNGLFVGALAGESFTLSQSYYYGSVSNNPSHEVVAIDGRALDLATELDAGAVGKVKPEPVAAELRPAPVRDRQLTDGGSHYALAALEDECRAIRTASDGSKHATLNKAAYAIGGLVSAGELQSGVAFGELQSALGTILPYCKDKRAAEKTLRTAFQEGVGAPRAVPERAVVVVDEVHPAAALIAKANATVAKREASPLPLPSGMMDCGGALAEFVDYAERTALSSQPLLALAAGICLIGVLAGRRYQTTTNLRTNLLAVSVADSGGGKDHARKRVKACLTKAGLSRYLGGEHIASGQAINTALAKHPSILFQIDEFGDFLSGVLGDKAGAHKQEIASKLKTLYSSAAETVPGTEYANAQERPRVDLHEPCACLYGTTTPGQLWKAIEGKSLHDGFVARVLFFVSPCSYPDDNPNLAFAEPPKTLLSKLLSIAAGGVRVDVGGNLPAPAIDVAKNEPNPEVMTVPNSDAAEAAFKALRQDQLKRLRENEGSYATSIIARFAETAMKLALLRAVSRDPIDPRIEAADVAWGAIVARHCTDTILREAERNVAETAHEAKSNKMLDVIRRHGPISDAEMLANRKLGIRALDERDRKEILRTLVESGDVIAIETGGGQGKGRRTIRYQFNPRGLKASNDDLSD